MRILVFKEGTQFVAQALEADFNAQGSNIETAIYNVQMAIALRLSKGGKWPAPAPDWFDVLWTKSKNYVSPTYNFSLGSYMNIDLPDFEFRTWELISP